MDCDAFYATIEKRDRPELRDKPLIIGGGKRGVVATACYLARMSGVHSAMPMFKALELCPQAVVLPPDIAKYARVGREVRHLMQELTPLVEPLSIDEAFLDLSGTQRLHKTPPALTLARLAQRVEQEIGISLSIGLSYCKFLAKMASDRNKPRGFSIIGRQEASGFLAALPVTALWGVGKALGTKLNANGLYKISQLQTIDETLLMKTYGSMGQQLYRLSRGIDTRKVDPEHAAKSISAERTFETDLRSGDTLIPVLRHLCETVAARLKAQDIAGHTVVLKLKSKNFQLKTRNRHLNNPTQTAERIFRASLELLEKELDGTAYRLLGIGVQQLTQPDNADPADLVDLQMSKRTAAENAMDVLRDRFGRQSIETGYTFGKKLSHTRMNEPE